ncbi:MAG: Endonuclease/exonuclease/phosphatase family [Moraxellaceae bacterium]|nr:Endonuclease/exonuclease/phosphatase family [Moraxellaceae bacterium]
MQPVPAPAAGEVTVATQNLKRLFDDVDDGIGKVVPTAEYHQRLGQLARQVDEVLRRPAVLAVQEVEHEKALADLAGALRARTGISWRPVAPEGQDSGGIDVGFLVRADWQVLAIEPLLARQKLDRHPLFDRPPLRLLLRSPQGREIEVINVHLKSLYGSDRDERAARRIARKRQQQAEALAAWLRAALVAKPPRRMLVLGDFNATPEVLGGVDVLGILQQAGLHSLLERLPEEERYTFVYRCRPEALDHVLSSPALLPAVARLAVSRGNAGARLRRDMPPDSALASSDHDGLVVYLRP